MPTSCYNNMGLCKIIADTVQCVCMCMWEGRREPLVKTTKMAEHGLGSHVHLTTNLRTNLRNLVGETTGNAGQDLAK